tara:strand:- start:847 stop:996 length:150 start_codon:yes stop_codon:yes gene_type:complete
MTTINVKEELKKKNKEEEVKRKDLKSLLNKDKLDNFELDIIMNDIDVFE